MAAYHSRPFEGYGSDTSAQNSPGLPTLGSPEVGGGAGRNSGYSRLGFGESGNMLHPSLVRQKSREQQIVWGERVHWFLPTMMVLLLVAGIMGAVAHDLFYSALEGQEAKNQLRMVRYGTALAFFTKASLVGSVVLAYRQRVWHTLRRKALTLGGIDNLFSVVEDPTRLVSKELFMKAKLATVMALATWLIPIASVLSPASLTTKLTEITLVNNRTCNATLLDFSLENSADWRNPKKGKFGHSLSFFNTTPPQPQDGIRWFDQPSFVAKKLQTLSTLGGKAIPVESPCKGYNCTWSVEFQAPWYNCTSRTDSEATAEMPSILNYTFSDLAPVGDKVYFAGSDVPEFERPQPDFNASTWDRQGIFTNEPAIWFGFVFPTGRLANDSGVVLPPGTKGSWPYVLQRHAMRCEMQRATYAISFAYTNNVQEANVSITDGRPVFEPLPGSDEIRPADPKYKEFAAYHSLGLLVRSIVAGHVQRRNASDSPVTSTQLSQTRLLDQSTSYTIPKFKTEFQLFFQEIILSLISEPFLEIAKNELVPCRITMLQNRFQYEKESLWIGYSISVVVALLSIITGGISIYSNGITSDITFSKILVTTRNRSLDKLVKQYEGVCLGADPFPLELKKMKLRFGVLNRRETDDDWAMHAAFGTVDETVPIIRGGSYKKLTTQSTHYQNRRSWTGGLPPPSYPGTYQMETRYSGPV